jgi:Rrf2 family protein
MEADDETGVHVPAALDQKKLKRVKIKLLKKDTDYAVKTLLYLAERGDDRVSAAELSRKLRIPYPFLRTILQTLNTAGILSSFKGQGGGFALALPPAEVYLADVIKALQGPISLAECIFRSKVCPGIRTCPLRKITVRLEENLVAELKPITLAGMLKKPASRRKQGVKN